MSKGEKNNILHFERSRNPERQNTNKVLHFRRITMNPSRMKQSIVKCLTSVLAAVGKKMGNKLPKWINNDLYLIIKMPDWDF